MVRVSRHVEAAALVADTGERATRLGSKPLMERADAIARRPRGHSVIEDPWHPLSSRELEVRA
jgi:hypothetical protein